MAPSDTIDLGELTMVGLGVLFALGLFIFRKQAFEYFPWRLTHPDEDPSDQYAIFTVVTGFMVFAMAAIFIACLLVYLAAR
jgi:hypothetical protein